MIFSAGFVPAADHVMATSSGRRGDLGPAPHGGYNQPMTEEQLRLIVREAIARHLGREALPTLRSPGPPPAWKAHPSHVRLSMPIGRDQDGPCLVEPDVKCTHCAFCQSYGH